MHEPISKYRNYAERIIKYNELMKENDNMEQSKVRGFEVIKDEMRKYPNVKIVLPKRGSSKSAGYDITTPVDIIIPPYGISDAIQTDIKAYMLDDEVLEIVPRSSIGFKKGLMLINTVGIIDSDYYSNKTNDGNIGFKLKNLTDKTVEIKAGERVLQGIFKKYLVTDDDDCETERTGGIGSTNKKDDSKFKVGDKVRIKSRVELRNTYYDEYCYDITSNMLKYGGRYAKIIEVIPVEKCTNPQNREYKLDIDRGEWYWYDNLLETE